jgi:uncharacterized protein RhaS with RHS repeats
VSIYDEDDNKTQYTYNAFGNPNEKYLMKVQEPDSSIITEYSRNILGFLTQIRQGSNITRVFEYYAGKPFLWKETHPESGTR